MCKYYEKNSNILLGYGLGVNITYDGLEKEILVDKIIEGVSLFEKDEIETLIIDGFLFLDDKHIKEIEGKINTKIIKGTGIIQSLLDNLLYKISNQVDIDIKDQEILIIGDDTELTKNVALTISKEAMFLTIYGNKHRLLEDIHKEVLLDTGLSIRSISDSINVASYDIIINLKDDFSIPAHKLKKKTIIFDLSEDKAFSKSINNSRKDIMVVDGLLLNNTTNIISDVDNLSFPNEIPEYIYEIGKNVTNNDIKKLRINGNYYKINEASNLFLRQSRKMSTFITK